MMQKRLQRVPLQPQRLKLPADNSQPQLSSRLVDDSSTSSRDSEKTLPQLVQDTGLKQHQEKQRQQPQQLPLIAQATRKSDSRGNSRLPQYIGPLSGAAKQHQKATVQSEKNGWLQKLLDILEDINEEWRNVASEYQKSRDKFNFLLSNVIGSEAVFLGPFGLRRVLYFDFVASGRSLRCVEDFIQSSVLPSYGNTHSSGSMVALQTNSYREEARRYIKKCVNAGPDDALIFTGSGATGAVQTLIGVLELQERKRRGERVSVVYGPFEHHSNILPWRELADVCVRATMNEAGSVDMAALAASLQQLRRSAEEAGSVNHLLIGAFSAASNVTGALTDTGAVTALLHSHGAIAVWDYACAGPHMAINMNSAPDSAFDALLLSPHKFVGGPGTPGVLVAKRRLFANRVPHRPGGGTVEYVTKDSHQYEKDTETREEGGTPAIVDCIRCGLVFRVKREIGDAEIEDREAELLRWAWEVLPSLENVLILGRRNVPRLPVFSFLVVNRETGLFLHHNFVSILLNDLYGVQSRAGCACAGPYAADLLEFDHKTLKHHPYLTDGNNRLKYCIDNYPRIKEQSRQKEGSSSLEELEIFKPGFVRINLPFFYTNEMIAYLFEAVDMVSRHGWKLLPEYQCNPHTGVWKHHKYSRKMRSLKEFHLDPRDEISFGSGAGGQEEACLNLQGAAASAKKVLLSAEGRLRKRIREGATFHNPLDAAGGMGAIESKIRWFTLPNEVVEALTVVDPR